MPKINGRRSSPVLIPIILMALTYLLIVQQQALASMARGISVALPNSPENVKVGSIIAHQGSEFVLSATPYDTEIFGVIVEQSSISLYDPAQEPLHLVMQSGEAQVLVSNANGDIKNGDYITSSDQAGVGQKADKPGFVLGKAMEDFTPAGNNEPSLLWITIEPRNSFTSNTVKTNLLETLRSGAISPLLNPVESLRYILAALIAAATFIIGFTTFGKSSGKTIEAMGRNPLAGGSIKTAMVFNTILSFGVMLVGLALAYLILVL
ncbi:hypothetical protein KKG63_02735 [Patescibacteria group bacterium]|nr:hypothetical protein [Patescibacteria group bacterium]